MAATNSPTQDNIFEAIRTFVLSVITCEVIQGLPNLVAMPVGGFISMTSLFQTRLLTNTSFYKDTFDENDLPTGTKDITQATEWTVQIDCYGDSSMQWANILTTLLRDDYSCRALAATKIQPLSADDPKQIPIVNGEQQYEQRWVITAKFQYNPVTAVPQQFFDEAVVVIHPAL